MENENSLAIGHKKTVMLGRRVSITVLYQGHPNREE
jgi:hypothetical protein